MATERKGPKLRGKSQGNGSDVPENDVEPGPQQEAQQEQPAQPGNGPQPVLQKLDKILDEEVAPLWDDRVMHRDPNACLLMKEFDRTVVYRIRPDPSTKSGKRHVPTAELAPDRSVLDLARMRGGGPFWLEAWRGKTIIVAKEIEIDGPEITPSSPIMGGGGVLGSDPIMETALGMLAIKGLDPMVQFAFTLLQAMIAHQREDARFLISQNVQMIATMRGGGGPGADILNYMQAMAEKSSRESAENREKLMRVMEQMSQLRLENLRIMSAKPGAQLDEAIAAQVPAVANAVVGMAGKVLENFTPKG